MSATQIDLLRYLAIEGSAVEALAQLGRLLDNEWMRALARAPALTDADYAQRLIELANTGRLPIGSFFELVGGAKGPHPSADGCVSDELLAQLRKRLAIILSRRQVAIEKLSAQVLAALTGRLVLLPTFASDGTMRYRPLARDTPDALAYALTRFLDPTLKLGGRLCRCRHRQCGNLFLAVREYARGCLRRDYCSPEHREEEQRKQSTERVIKSRNAKRLALERERKARARKHK